MSEEEVGRMIASFIAENLASLMEIGKDAYKMASNEMKLYLEKTYSSYLREKWDKYSQTKSFFIRHSPVDFYEFYVPIAVESSNNRIDEPSFENLVNESGRVAVLGTGGCGKSVLMKHLFLSCIKYKKQVPVFVELREINSQDLTLSQLIFDALNSESHRFDKEYIDKAIYLGHFSFILDGFDEVSNCHRKKLIKEIKLLSRSSKECSIVISSRPDEVFSGIDEFKLFKVVKMSLDSACLLVEKLPFDEDVKGKFTKELKDGMYEQHKSFLSNPLLLSIMLLTYGQNAEIPTKLSIFYSQAYEALFQRHDALKGGYKRERQTGLDIQDFAKIFSVFCLQTYDKRLFRFTRMDALDFVDKSKRHLSESFNNEGYLDDALKATCLLIEDGLDIVFSHRSFQEYFVALYISKASPEVQKKLIGKYWKNIRSDNVICLLYEINKDLVERLLFIPIISRFYKDIGVSKKVGITHYVKYLKNSFSTINFEDEVSASLKNVIADDHDILRFSVLKSGIVIIPNDFDFDEEQKYLMNKYKKGGERTEYKTGEFTYKKELVRDLSKGYGAFSIQYLQSGYNYLKQLQKKHKEIENSLNDLLSI
nr:NACHT domain-containing protein [uncultured Desulfuromonas sp.]